MNANLGWTNIDSNISDGEGTTICWWDPWWGYVCDTFLSTYQKDYWHYGIGVGLRVDMNRDTFLRVGYHRRWLDLDNSPGTSSFDGLRFEFGLSSK